MKKLLLTAIFAVGLLSSQAQRAGVGTRMMGYMLPKFSYQKALDCPGGEVKPNQFLQIWDAHGGDPEKWVLEVVDDRVTPWVLAIKPVNNLDYALTISNGRFTEGNDIVLQRYTGASNQKWKTTDDGYVISFQNPLWCMKVEAEDKGGEQWHYKPGQRVKLHKRGPAWNYDLSSIWVFKLLEVW